MAVDSIGALSSAVTSGTQKTSGAGLQNQFLELLVAQMKNQDPLSPMERCEFISELAQLESLDEQIKTNESNQALLLQSSLATGSSMIGKLVAGNRVENEQVEEVVGIVTSMKVEGGNITYSIVDENDNYYSLPPEQVTAVTLRDWQ
ncbi:MAG: hypothetical protein HQL31_12930 [Planctomycetes bacterium]|nr:hypothetical protein [Planctomycetota bacterium]